MEHIPYGRQNIIQNDIDIVTEVLKSDFLTQGPKVPLFEEKVKSITGAKYALASNSATSSLHIACLALGVGAGDVVWTSAITFVASSNCALYCGAEVDFVDIEPDTFNMCPKKLKEKLEAAKSKGKLPKVVIPVHMTGQACDMEAIAKLAREYNFSVIEDASHAIGGKYKGEYIGNCKYSDITVFSFHPVKIVTTAEGGMNLTNSESLAQSMSLFRSHGITRDQSLMHEKSHGPWYYEQIELGYNYRMTELQAALGISQLDRLDDLVKRRHEIVNYYDKELSSLPLKLPVQRPENYSAFHLYVIRLKLNEIKKTHLEVFNSLRADGIGVNLHYIPVYFQPYYKNLGFKKGLCPNAEAYYAEAITLPIYPDMTQESLTRIITALQRALT